MLNTCYIWKWRPHRWQRLGINHKSIVSYVLALESKMWKLFFQKSISMRDVSNFRDNFSKLNVRNLQKVPNRWRRNFVSELYGFVKFVKRIIIIISLWMPKTPRNFHKKIGPLISDFLYWIIFMTLSKPYSSQSKFWCRRFEDF